MLTIQDLQNAKWRYYIGDDAWFLEHQGKDDLAPTALAILRVRSGGFFFEACLPRKSEPFWSAKRRYTIKYAQRRARRALAELMKEQGVPEC